MKGLDVTISDLDLTKDYAIYLGRLLGEVRNRGDIELIHALERDIIQSGNFLPKNDDLKLF